MGESKHAACGRIGALAAALALLLSGGCSAVTDFDFEFAGDGAVPPDGGTMDGSPGDGGDTDGGTGDGGTTDGGGTDGGGPVDGGGTDGGTPVCEPPCVGDAVLQFDETQDGPWRYEEDTRADNGLSYRSLVWDEWDGQPAWTSEEGAPPAIMTCRGRTALSRCAGLGDYLLMSTAGPAPGGGSPTLEFVAPANGTYELQLRARTAEAVTVTEQIELLVSRNVRHVKLFRESFLPSRGERAFAVTTELLEGERLVITLGPGTTASEQPEPLGVRARVTRITGSGDAFPGRCQAAVDFDAPGVFTESCHDLSFTDLGVLSGVPGPNESRLGQAQQITSGGSLDWGPHAFDYSQDFTIDLWTRVTEPASLNAIAVAHESTHYLTPSIETWSDGDTAMVTAQIHHAADPSTCGDSCSRLALENSRPDDSAWHHFRLTRSTANGDLRLCIDGELAASEPLSGEHAVIGGNTLQVGRAGTSDGTFAGAVDDLRITTRALPCR